MGVKLNIDDYLEQLNKLPYNVLNDVIIAVDNELDFVGADKLYTLDEFADLNCDTDPIELVRQGFYSSNNDEFFCFMHKFWGYNNYGNLWSSDYLNYYEKYTWQEVVDYIIDNGIFNNIKSTLPQKVSYIIERIKKIQEKEEK